jgi:periplasmic protein TonB
MRFTLPESSHRRQRSAGGALLSAALHAVTIGGTIVATGMSAEQPRAVIKPPEKLIFVKRDDTMKPPTAKPDQSSVRPILRPIPDRFVPPVDVIVDPTAIPTTIPDVGVPLALPFDSTASAVGGGSSSVSGGSTHGAGDTGEAMSAMAVDREVVPLGGITPRYPGMLAIAGIEGTVVMQFVVDTLGRVERESVRVVRADQRMFVESVREALTRMRFVPAEAAGRKVRQLVEQSFAFALARH